jgi:glycosyltransferase involved in cell wall biosynthesis
MKIVIGPIRVPAGASLTYTRGQENPGLGGTDFLALERAARLAEWGNVERIQVVLIGGTARFSNSKVEALQISELSEFFPPPGWVTISSVGNLEHVPPQNLRDCSLVVLSHHPHDDTLLTVCERFNPSAVISTGKYPYWSVDSKISVPHFQIRDPFSPSTIASKESVTERYEEPLAKVGHISSLHPAKGFLDIAMSWRIIHDRFPNMRLEVIGGISLYDSAETHPTLPMERDYGDKILEALGSAASSVDFLGLIGDGKDRITKYWHVALLNPRGISEADPASFKDCMRAGVPVIGGDDYGLGDYMESFPALKLKEPEDLVEVFQRTVDRPEELLLEAQKALSIAKILATQDELHWKVFEELVSRVARQDTAGLTSLARGDRPKRLTGRKQLKILARNTENKIWEIFRQLRITLA